MINKNSILEQNGILGIPDYETNSISSHGSAHLINAPKSEDIGANDRSSIIDYNYNPLLLHQPKFHIDAHSLEERKSISAKPTYVVSAKLTHISPIDDSEVTVQQNPNFHFQQLRKVFYERG